MAYVGCDARKPGQLQNAADPAFKAKRTFMQMEPLCEDGTFEPRLGRYIFATQALGY